MVRVRRVGDEKRVVDEDGTGAKRSVRKISLCPWDSGHRVCCRYNFCIPCV